MYMFNHIEMARVTGVPPSYLLTRWADWLKRRETCAVCVNVASSFNLLLLPLVGLHPTHTSTHWHPSPYGALGPAVPAVSPCIVQAM
jgi:hypothetical protein